MVLSVPGQPDAAAVPDTAAALGPPAHLPRRARWARSLPFAAVVLIGFSLAWVPPRVTSGYLLAAVALTGVIAAGIAWLPWRRWHPDWAATPALAFLAVVALLRHGADGSASGYLALAFLPILWLALYHSRRMLLVGLALLGALLAGPALIMPGQDYPLTEWRRSAVTVAAAALVGMATQRLVRGLRHTTAELSRAGTWTREQHGVLSAVLAAATEQAIFAADRSGAVTVFNVGAERMLGHRAAEVVGRVTTEVFHLPAEVAARAAELGVPPGPEVFAHAVRCGRTETQEWTFVHRDGHHIPVVMSVSPLRREGRITGYVGIARDITVERRAAAALDEALTHERRASDRLREVNQIKSDFVATVSHELRTPLTSIIGNTELILDGHAGTITPRQQRLLEAVERNGRRLHLLVADLLMLSRVEAGTLKLRARPVAVTELLTGALEAVAHQRTETGVPVDVRLPATPVMVHGDPQQLERVMINLLSNALKFTPPEGRVEIVAHADATRVRIEVCDTGMGIPDDEITKIFDRFFRSTAPAHRDRPGTGLGLTIAQAVINQHGGAIDVRSEPGVGTTFVVDLPRADCSATDPTQAPTAPPKRQVRQ